MRILLLLVASRPCCGRLASLALTSSFSFLVQASFFVGLVVFLRGCHRVVLGFDGEHFHFQRVDDFLKVRVMVVYLYSRRRTCF